MERRRYRGPGDGREVQILGSSIKHYEEGSRFGIEGGRVSKLTIRRFGEPRDLCNYDRGWDIEPADEVKTVYALILEKYN